MFQPIKRNITAVIDTSVIAHKIENICSEKGFDLVRSIAYTRNAIAHIASLEWLGAYADLDNYACNVIWVKDVKVGGCYWRTEYLATPEVTLAIAQNQPNKGKGVKARRRLLELAGAPEKTEAEKKELTVALKEHTQHYKGGRKQASDLFMSVRSEVYAIIDRNGWCVLEKPKYEADDLAAAVCVINQMLPFERQHHILLATVDTDWLGLVDENVAWMCTTGTYEPRLRNSLQSINWWAERRLKVTLETPSDIWAVKTIQGDKSDNLPPGTPQEIIDLKAPPEEHRLWNDPAIVTKVRGWLLEPTGVQISAAQMAQVRRFFAANTVRPAIPAFNPDYDIYQSY